MAVRSDTTLNHMGTTNYDALFSEMMKAPEVRKEYDTLELEFQLVRIPKLVIFFLISRK